MKAILPFKTPVTIQQWTQRNFPEDFNLQQHRCQNFVSRYLVTVAELASETSCYLNNIDDLKTSPIYVPVFSAVSGSLV